MVRTICKLTLVGLEHVTLVKSVSDGAGGTKQVNQDGVCVQLSAKYNPDGPEDRQFGDATPHAEFTANVTKDAAGLFEGLGVGAKVKVTFEAWED